MEVIGEKKKGKKMVTEMHEETTKERKLNVNSEEEEEEEGEVAKRDENNKAMNCLSWIFFGKHTMIRAG